MVAGELPSLSTLPDTPLIRDRVYEALLDQLVRGELRPGDRIVERVTAAQLGISTTPLKEALRRLENEGFVRTVPRRGVVVSEHAMTSIGDVVAVRAALESLAARLAAERFATRRDDTDGVDGVGPGDQERLRAAVTALAKPGGSLDAVTEVNARFHHVVRELSGNRLIVQFVGMLLGVDTVLRRKALSDPDEMQRGLDDHRAIGAAIATGDAERAEHLMREHVLRSAAHSITADQEETR